MKRLNETTIVVMLWGTMILYIGAAIHGGIITYSPVPFWDMWDGINSLLKPSSGDLRSWWAQHNEHRIVLARLLFWIDLRYFNAQMWPLIVVNFLLVAASALTFIIILNNHLPDRDERLPFLLLAPVLVIILFSWGQHENLTWAFQSQCFLAQLLPLIAFFLLSKSRDSSAYSARFFAAACVLGIVSLGSMANAVLTLPVMAALALALQMNRSRVLFLFSLVIIGVGLYLLNYSAPAHHGSLADTLMFRPGDVARYILLYLGGPFYFAAGGSKSAAYTGAVFMLGTMVFFLWKSLMSPKSASLQLALLAFLLYIVGTAVLTAGGRIVFGLDQALSSRYQTPTLMAWAAVLVLYAPSLAKLFRAYQGRAAMTVLVIPLALLPQQLDALKPEGGLGFEKLVAALALELGIKDQTQIATVYPDAEAALALAAIPVEKNLSVFSSALLKDARQFIGRIEIQSGQAQCHGSLDQAVAIDGDDRYVRVRGFLFHPEIKMTPKIVHLLNDEGRVVGYALTGEGRPGFGVASDSRAANSGFKGYLIKEQFGSHLTLVGITPSCAISLP